MIKPMLCNVYKEGKIPFPCHVQPKLDGVRCLLDNTEAYTRNGKRHKDHIQELLEPHMPGFDSWATLDGELMLPDATFQQTISAVKKDSENTRKLVYHVYDFCPAKGRVDFFDFRNSVLEVEITDGENIKVLPTYMVRDQEELDLYHRDFVGMGYEGTIIRDLKQPYLPGSRKAMWKRKDFKDDEFKIVGCEEGQGKNAGTPVFICQRWNSDSYSIFRCVPVGTYARKRQMWADRDSLVGKMMTVRYQELTDGGVPRFPVGVEIRDYE